MEEIWKDIDGFVGLYKISSFGNILSLNLLRHKKPRILNYKNDGNIKMLFCVKMENTLGSVSMF